VSRLTSILLLLGSAGIVVSAYLGAFEVGATNSVWDPLFGDGSRQVLTSAFSRQFPIPDAFLGTLAYVVDVALTLLIARRFGGERIRVALAVFAGFGALASVGLLGAQLFVVHALCTLCLVSAAISWTLAVGAAIAAWRGADIPFQPQKEAQST
jgi:uncharacterized membrane protein